MRGMRSRPIATKGAQRSRIGRPASSMRHSNEMESCRSPAIDDGVRSKARREMAAARSYSPRAKWISARCHTRWLRNQLSPRHGWIATGSRVTPVSKSADS